MTRQKKMILLVEDNDDTRFALGAILRLGGYDVVEAVDGSAGLDAAREKRPDLILTDLRMPKMNGFALGDALRSDGVLAEIPVVAVTAERLGQRRRKRADELFHSVVRKPVDPRGFRSHIEGVLAGA